MLISDLILIASGASPTATHRSLSSCSSRRRRSIYQFQEARRLLDDRLVLRCAHKIVPALLTSKPQVTSAFALYLFRCWDTVLAGKYHRCFAGFRPVRSFPMAQVSMMTFCEARRLHALKLQAGPVDDTSPAPTLYYGSENYPSSRARCLLTTPTPTGRRSTMLSASPLSRQPSAPPSSQG